MPKDSVENNAIAVVTTYLQKQGYEVQNVSRGKKPNSGHGGFDLLARKSGEEIKIEVKGTTVPWGIPDPYVTEFDKTTLRLIADFLYVVYFVGSEPPFICVIPREALKPEDIVLKFGYRIKGRFKNKRSLEPYMREL